MDLIFKQNRVFRLRLPGLPPLALAFDPGSALVAGSAMFVTDLVADHYRKGRLYERYNLGSGVVTNGGVNAIVSDVVAGSSVVPTLARYKYMDSGTGGATAETSAQTALTTPITSGPARTVLVPGAGSPPSITNGQTASGTSSTNVAKILYQGTITYNTVGPTYPIAISEWGLFDAAGSGNPLAGGNMWDRRSFSGSIINVNSGDSITYSYSLSIPAGS